MQTISIYRPFLNTGKFVLWVNFARALENRKKKVRTPSATIRTVRTHNFRHPSRLPETILPVG
jgi:hypothetical protein